MWSGVEGEGEGRGVGWRRGKGWIGVVRGPLAHGTRFSWISPSCFTPAYLQCRFRAKCYLKLGQWETALLNEGVVPMSSSKDKYATLQRYKRVLELDPRWYQAWHAWALANEEVMGLLKGGKQELELSPDVVKHIVAAAEGFISSIKYGRNKSVVLQVMPPPPPVLSNPLSLQAGHWLSSKGPRCPSSVQRLDLVA